MSYDYKTFWDVEGKKPVGRKEERFKNHVIVLPSFLDDLEFKTVLEIGPGDGRITELLLDNYAIEKYDVIDISQDRLNMIKLPVNKTCSNIVDYEIKENYDLIISTECFLHIKPEHIEKLLEKLSNHCKYLVNIDYFPKESQGTLVYYNFIHDYESIYKKLGLNVRKRRIDTEVLFVATKN